MEESVLKTIKQLLGLSADYAPFDEDIKVHINMALATLRQIGVGAANFEVKSEVEKWVDVIGIDKDLASVKSFVYFKVRLAFDPPSTSFAIQAIEKQLEELSFRLTVEGERISNG